MKNTELGGVLPKTNRDDSPVVITTQTEDGTFKAHLFPNREEAHKAMEEYKARASIDDKRYLEGGFITKTGTQCRMIPFSEAFRLDGRIVWEVSHTCFYPDTDAVENWSHVFGDRTTALEFFEEQLQLYWAQAAQLEQVRIERDFTHASVFVNEKLVVKLEANPRVIGETDPSAGLVLTRFIENGDQVDISKMLMWS